MQDNYIENARSYPELSKFLSEEERRVLPEDFSQAVVDILVFGTKEQQELLQRLFAGVGDVREGIVG